MAKNVLIIILVVLLAISSYLLFQTGEPIVNFWAKEHSKELPGSVADRANDREKVEKLEPEPSPELYAEPSIRLTIEQIEDDKDELDGKAIHLRYRLIGPSIFEVIDSKGELAVRIDFESGEALFGSNYSPDDASTQFWKSIAKKYPEVCIVKENQD